MLVASAYQENMADAVALFGLLDFLLLFVVSVVLTIGAIRFIGWLLDRVA